MVMVKPLMMLSAVFYLSKRLSSQFKPFSQDRGKSDDRTGTI